MPSKSNSNSSRNSSSNSNNVYPVRYVIEYVIDRYPTKRSIRFAFTNNNMAPKKVKEHIKSTLMSQIRNKVPIAYIKTNYTTNQYSNEENNNNNFNHVNNNNFNHVQLYNHIFTNQQIMNGIFKKLKELKTINTISTISQDHISGTYRYPPKTKSRKRR